MKWRSLFAKIKLPHKKTSMAHLEHIEDAYRWLNTRLQFTSRVHAAPHEKLQAILKALDYFDNPQHAFKAIHITGTKGKSSTSYSLSYILKQKNINVGLFTSPHIHRYNERIQINHEEVEDQTLLVELREIEGMMRSIMLPLTMFEIMTLAACKLFKKAHVEYAIFEVGIGGRYDTTNFLHPTLCIITNIELEHSEVLGNHIEDIAYEKAGIIKEYTPVFIGFQNNLVCLDVISKYAKTLKSQWIYIPDHINTRFQDASYHFRTQAVLDIVNDTLQPHQEFLSVWKNIEVESISTSELIVNNQVLSDIAAHYLLNKTPEPKRIYPHAAQLMCRAELLVFGGVTLFLDGAHTSLSIQEALKCISHIYSKSFQQVSYHILILGMVKGKNYADIIERIKVHHSIIDELVITTPGNLKDSVPEELLEYSTPLFSNISLIPNNLDANLYAFNKAKSHTHALISVVGSFYLCASSRSFYLKKTN